MQSSPPLLPIKPLDGIDGYRRWKESILLRLRTLNIAHVLFDRRPTSWNAAASKRWDADDALCRGHILYTLSDRLFGIHVHRSTAKNLWLALQRNYAKDIHPVLLSEPRLAEFVLLNYDPILEQIAKLEAVAAAEGIKDENAVARLALNMLPHRYSRYVKEMKKKTMEELCRVLRVAEAAKVWKEDDTSSSGGEMER